MMEIETTRRNNTHEHVMTRIVGEGYEVKAEGDDLTISIDHSKARVERLPSAGEVERFTVVSK